MATKKPSIGDAVTILQSKVSGINQVVSVFATTISTNAPLYGETSIFLLVKLTLTFTLLE